jgi:hypothetical protein
MTEQADRVAAAIGYVCGHLVEIRDNLADLGDAAPLDKLLAAVRDGSDPTGPLDRLHKTLQASGDVLGVYVDPSRAVGPRPVGIAPPGPSEVVFLCPHLRCSRYSWPRPGGDAAPACEIDDTPMTPERLR